MDIPPKIHPFEAVALTLIFAVAITLPIVKMQLIGEPDTSSAEKRTLSAEPILRGDFKYLVKTLPKQYDEWFADHFGFRSLLLQAGSLVNVEWFRYSPRIQIGRDGWLFYHLDPPLFSQSLDGDALAKWKNYLELRQRWLAARGVKYLFVIAPDKDSIYPEFLPPTAGRPPVEMPVDQLIRYLAETHSSVQILSLRQPLLDAKSIESERLYSKQDGHWNSLGAFYGYQAIIRRLAQWYPGLKPESRDAYRLDFARERGRDLAHLAGLPDFTALQDPVLMPLSPRAFSTDPPGSRPSETRRMTTELQESSNLPRAVMIRDSFTDALVPYLSLNFSRITYLSFQFDLPDFEGIIAETVHKEKPDIFIEERIQRYLPSAPDARSMFDSIPPTP